MDHQHQADDISTEVTFLRQKLGQLELETRDLKTGAVIDRQEIYRLTKSLEDALDLLAAALKPAEKPLPPDSL